MAIDEEEKSKGSNILQIISIILIIASSTLILSSLGLLPNFPKDKNFLNYGMFLLAPAFFILFLSILTGAGKGVKKFEVFTSIKCQDSSCKYVLIRDFKRNDFVFKQLEDLCPKCNSHIYIADISSIPTKKFKEIPEKALRSKKPKQDKKEKKLKTITTLKCDNSECNFIKTRNFEPNDYVFKKIDDKTCSKCGSVLYISKISHTDPEETA